MQKWDCVSHRFEYIRVELFRGAAGLALHWEKSKMAIIFDMSRLSPSLRSEIENSAKWRKLFSSKPDKLLSFSADAKTVKGEKKGFLTGILYLSPANSSGENVCPMAAIAACDLPCLVTAGRGAMTKVAMARLRKTLFFLQYRAEFMAVLANDIKRGERMAAKQGFSLVIRLNGTSDIRWERLGIIQAFPHVQFMDYTKIANRRNLPANYDVTYSYSGAAAFQPFVKEALANGLRLAVVFRRTEKVRYLIDNGATMYGRAIVDGDENDLRFLDPVNSIVALYAKGRAKLDNSGFVVDGNHRELIYSMAIAA